MSSSSAGTGIPIAKLSVGIGVDRAQLNQVGTDVQRKLDETGEKGSKNPLMEKLLFGKGGPEGFQNTAERVVTRGLFGRMGRLVSSGGFGALGILLATRELVSLGHELFSGGEAAKEFAEKVEKGRDALREMSRESIKAENALLKVDEKWRTLLAGKSSATALEKLKRAGVSKDATEVIEEGIKASEEEREDADKHLAPFFDRDNPEKRQAAIEAETARNAARLKANPAEAGRFNEGVILQETKDIFRSRGRPESSFWTAERLHSTPEWQQAISQLMTRETISGLIGKKVDAEHNRNDFERRAKLGAEMLPKETTHADARAKVGSLESFANKIIEMGVGKNESDEIPKETRDILLQIRDLLKTPAPIKPVVK
jgi:hypothetical protein